MSVSIAVAKRDLSELIKQAKEEPVVITRRSVPDAALISYNDYLRFKRMEAYVGMLRIAEKMRGRGINVDELLEESRRELEERGD